MANRLISWAKPGAWPALRDTAYLTVWDQSTDRATLRDLRTEIGRYVGVSGKPSWLHRLAPKIQLKRSERINARLLLSLIDWRLDGTFTPPFENNIEARYQFWETEWFCPLTDYQTKFVRAAAEAYPKDKPLGFFSRIYRHIDPATPAQRELRGDDVQIMRTPGATHTIIGFSGLRHNCLGIGWPTFYRVVASAVPANLVILKDYNEQLYMGGIARYGDKAQSLAALRELMSEFDDTDILFLGASAGTFGALTYAGHLSAKRVVCLSGPSSLEIGFGNENKHIYKTLKDLIDEGRLEADDAVTAVNAGKVGRIDYFLSGGNTFDVAQMRNLYDHAEGVVPHMYPGVDHAMTDLCIGDGRLVRACRGEPLEPMGL